MTVNGSSFGNFGYNKGTQTLTASLTLTNGLSVIEITAENPHGKDEKSIQITYTPPNTGGGNENNDGGGSGAKGKEGSKCTPTVNAVFSPDFLSVEASSTLDLSNVVLKFHDGKTQKIENLSGLKSTFSGSGNNQGKCIVGVWIKSGCNQSKDGPGYGEWVANTNYDKSCEGTQIKQQQKPPQGSGGVIIQPSQPEGGKEGGDNTSPNADRQIQIQPSRGGQTTQPAKTPTPNTGGVKPPSGGTQATPAPTPQRGTMKPPVQVQPTRPQSTRPSTPQPAATPTKPARTTTLPAQRNAGGTTVQPAKKTPPATPQTEEQPVPAPATEEGKVSPASPEARPGTPVGPN